MSGAGVADDEAGVLAPWANIAIGVSAGACARNTFGAKVARQMAILTGHTAPRTDASPRSAASGQGKNEQYLVMESVLGVPAFGNSITTRCYRLMYQGAA
jgi:hypothetical protein